jgi:hypothetical protein
MLISMPHGTSTTFGAFQAILASSPCERDELTPSVVKLSSDEKFASEFFRPETITGFVATQQYLPPAISGPTKAMWYQRLHSRSVRERCGIALGLLMPPK